MAGAGAATPVSSRPTLERRLIEGHATTLHNGGPAHDNLRRTMMRVLVMVKASRGSEAGEMPSKELLTAMNKFNEELANAGIMLAAEGLHPSSKGKRVHFSGTRRTVTDGPFAETKELVAGFWLWQVKSMEEAVEWVKRCPNPMMEDSDIEIRRVFEAEDFGAEFTPELRAQAEETHAKASQRAKAPRP